MPTPFYGYRSVRQIDLEGPAYPSGLVGVTTPMERYDFWKCPPNGALIFGARLFFGHIQTWDGLIEYNVELGLSAIDPTTDPRTSALVTDNTFGGIGFQKQPAQVENQYYATIGDWVTPPAVNPANTNDGLKEIWFRKAYDEHNAGAKAFDQHDWILPQNLFFELREGQYLLLTSLASPVTGSPASIAANSFQHIAGIWYIPRIDGKGKIHPYATP